MDALASETRAKIQDFQPDAWEHELSSNSFEKIHEEKNCFRINVKTRIRNNFRRLDFVQIDLRANDCLGLYGEFEEEYVVYEDEEEEEENQEENEEEVIDINYTEDGSEPSLLEPAQKRVRH